MLENLSINLQELNSVTVIFRMFLAILIGGIIGMERDFKHRAAGLRTHMLVTLGSAIVMMTNEYIYETYPDATIDITRMGAQVVSGIGFIGAGTILITRENRVKGLTTAAGLWAAATIGLAIGIGFYEIAFYGGLAILAIVVLMRPLKRYIQDKVNDSDITLMVHAQNGFKDFLRYTATVDVKIADLQIEKELMTDDDENDMIFSVTIELGEQLSRDDFLEYLRLTEGIIDVVEVEG